MIRKQLQAVVEPPQRMVGFVLMLYDIALLFYLAWKVALKVPLHGYKSWAIVYITASAFQLVFLLRNMVGFLLSGIVYRIHWARNTTLTILILRSVFISLGLIEKVERESELSLVIVCGNWAVTIVLCALVFLWGRGALLNFEKQMAEKLCRKPPKMSIKEELSEDLKKIGEMARSFSSPLPSPAKRSRTIDIVLATLQEESEAKAAALKRQSSCPAPSNHSNNVAQSPDTFDEIMVIDQDQPALRNSDKENGTNRKLYKIEEETAL